MNLIGNYTAGRLFQSISGPLRDPLIAAGCFAIGLRGSALRAPPIRPMEPTAILSIRQKFYEFSPNACDSRGSSGGVMHLVNMVITTKGGERC